MTGVRVVLLAALLSMTGGACTRAREVLDDLREGSATIVDEMQVAPLPVFEFVESTAAQRELLAAALAAFAEARDDEAVAALLTLGDTPEPSETRATGTLLLADRYHMEGRYAEALVTLDRLANSSPPKAALEFLRGRTLVELGRIADAEDALRRATRLDADFLRAYPVLAVLLADNGRLEDARDVMLHHDRAVARIADRLSAGHSLADRLAAVQALSRGWRDDSVSRALEPALRDPSMEVVAAALDAFVDVGTAISAEALLGMRESVDPQLSERLDAAISAVGAQAPPVEPSRD